MKHLLRILTVMLALAITSGASMAYAQDTSVFDTPFAFRLGTQVHQPGSYTIRVSDDEMTVAITPAKGAENVAMVMTRLAEPEPPLREGKVVFDKVGDVYYLSEVWMPGSDGFLLHAAKEKHTHVKVTLAKKG